MNTEDNMDVVVLAAELTIAWLSNPSTRVQAEDVPGFLANMHSAVANLSGPSAEPVAEAAQEHVGAVSVRKSLASPDHIISMIDGKPYRTLRRHLSTHGLTPDDYRARYGLRQDYPMVAQSYSESRREMAKKIGLGRKPRTAQAAPAAEAPAERPAKRGRGKAAAA